MPFKSQAQRAKFYATPELHKYIPEFEADTPTHLPHRLHVPRASHRKEHSQSQSRGRVPERKR